ncbi:MAG TPA: BlaI/MecI/CopY family transcriptional regulator [Streptosporangiaceae bacterium]|nr:BlaI/MecI/CopY family transcriptional regulator [Streptosporangiaceae bacterium]
MREFGQLESAIMDVVWSQDQPLLVREVRDRLHYARPVAYTTVMTVMTILHGKGVLRREKQGRAWRYWPHEQRAAHYARLMAEILRSGADTTVTIQDFVALLTADELAAIRSALGPRPARTAAAG